MPTFQLIDLGGRGASFNIRLLRTANAFGGTQLQTRNYAPKLCELIVCGETVDVADVVDGAKLFINHKPWTVENSVLKAGDVISVGSGISVEEYRNTGGEHFYKTFMFRLDMLKEAEDCIELEESEDDGALSDATDKLENNETDNVPEVINLSEEIDVLDLDSPEPNVSKVTDPTPEPYQNLSEEIDVLDLDSPEPNVSKVTDPTPEPNMETNDTMHESDVAPMTDRINVYSPINTEDVSPKRIDLSSTINSLIKRLNSPEKNVTKVGPIITDPIPGPSNEPRIVNNDKSDSDIAPDEATKENVRIVCLTDSDGPESDEPEIPEPPRRPPPVQHDLDQDHESGIGESSSRSFSSSPSTEFEIWYNPLKPTFKNDHIDYYEPAFPPTPPSSSGGESKKKKRGRSRKNPVHNTKKRSVNATDSSDDESVKNSKKKKKQCAKPKKPTQVNKAPLKPVAEVAPVTPTTPQIVTDYNPRSRVQNRRISIIEAPPMIKKSFRGHKARPIISPTKPNKQPNNQPKKYVPQSPLRNLSNKDKKIINETRTEKLKELAQREKDTTEKETVKPVTKPKVKVQSKSRNDMLVETLIRTAPKPKQAGAGTSKDTQGTF